MLKLREVCAYAPIVNQVVGDLLQRIDLLRSRSQDQVTVSNLPAELYKFGFEGKRCSKTRSGEHRGKLLTLLTLRLSFTLCRYLLHLVWDQAGLPAGGNSPTNTELHRCCQQHADAVWHGDPFPALDPQHPPFLEALCSGLGWPLQRR